MRAPHAAAFLLASLLAFAPRAARAQERAGGRPCIRLLLIESTPANLEWTWWLAGGGGVQGGGGAPSVSIPSLGIGTEATAGLAQIGSPSRYGGPFELRWGPWWGLTTDLEGMRGEGGLTMSFGQVEHAQWGTYALRIGGGFGDDGLGPAPHLVATLTGGVRYAPARHSERGACDPDPQPKGIAFVTGVRLFASARTALAPQNPWQITFGLEFEPTFFLPPYSLRKLAGVSR
ncbi:hypothetical protein [Polyangium aurulentum]|uniref:hypothetical protein n=1 Tax=Polyangium aurulentum TaxID=2567896 RepID=UPI0010AEAD8F|nr:hypothetical protein [Polyangium aurulentum]UQA57234.1 hypothetical protein E8A73_039005 [Polyangium aurulentum]